MRRIFLALVIAGCGSSATADKVQADEGKTEAGVADTVEVARPKPPPKKIIVPSADTIAAAPTKKAVKKNKWFAFGGTYFRLWGGTLAGSQPKGVSVTVDGRVFLTNTGFHNHKNVQRWDIDKLKVIKSVSFKGNAVESAVSPDGKLLFVSNFYHEEVLALSTDNLRIKKRYKVGKVPKHLAVAPDGKTFYVSNWESHTTSAVDVKTGKVLRHIKVGKNPRGTAITRDAKKLYVTNFGAGNVMVIDVATLTVIRTIDDRCRAARHAAVTRDDKLVLVTCYGGEDMMVIDRETDKVVRRVKLGRGPKTVVVSQDGKFAYTANYKDNTMSIVDLATWKALTFPVPAWKTSGAAVAPDDRRIYITGWDSRNLLVFERLMPGDVPSTKVGPRQPRGKCRRVKKKQCFQFP